MEEFEHQGGVAFIILSYTARNELYYLPFEHIKSFWNRMEAGGRKSFTYEEVDQSFAIRAHRDMYVHYLEPLQKDLERKQEANKD